MLAYRADVDPYGYPYYVNSAGKYLYRSQATNRWMLNGVHGAHFEACMTEIYLHIDARVADYIRTHPYAIRCGQRLRLGQWTIGYDGRSHSLADPGLRVYHLLGVGVSQRMALHFLRSCRGFG